jgi:fructokinase
MCAASVARTLRTSHRTHDVPFASFLRHADRSISAELLSGGMSNVQEIYPRIGEVISKYSFGVKATTPVRQAVHGDSSGVRGAAWLCR